MPANNVELSRRTFSDRKSNQVDYSHFRFITLSWFITFDLNCNCKGICCNKTYIPMLEIKKFTTSFLIQNPIVQNNKIVTVKNWWNFWKFAPSFCFKCPNRVLKNCSSLKLLKSKNPFRKYVTLKFFTLSLSQNSQA